MKRTCPAVVGKEEKRKLGAACLILLALLTLYLKPRVQTGARLSGGNHSRYESRIDPGGRCSAGQTIGQEPGDGEVEWSDFATVHKRIPGGLYL